MLACALRLCLADGNERLWRGGNIGEIGKIFYIF